MIGIHDALALLAKHGLHPDVVAHCVGVSEFAGDLAQRIAERHPELGIDPEKVRIAALLHDVGRGSQEDHELRSVEILRQEGLGEIADIVLHGMVYETSVLRGKDDKSLLPQTLEQKIVCYADLRFCQAPMSLRERIEDALERKKHRPQTVWIIRKAEGRFFDLEKELLDLAESGAELGGGLDEEARD